MELVTWAEEIFSTEFTREDIWNIVWCFTSMLVTSLDIMHTSLLLAQEYEKVTNAD